METQGWWWRGAVSRGRSFCSSSLRRGSTATAESDLALFGPDLMARPAADPWRTNSVMFSATSLPGATRTTPLLRRKPTPSPPWLRRSRHRYNPSTDGLGLRHGGDLLASSYFRLYANRSNRMSLPLRLILPCPFCVAESMFSICVIRQ